MSDRMLSDEILLGIINSKSGGGGGGTDDYNDLSNQPQVNNHTLIGNKTASDLGLVAAETGKGLSENNYTDADKAIVGGVTAALAGKQNALTAGKYINIDANNEISVDPVVPNEAFTYTIQQIGDGIVKITKTVSGAVVFEKTYNGNADITLDALHYVYSNGAQSYTLLIASDTHEAGFKQSMSWWARDTFTENFSTVDHSGEKLVIKSELDAAVDAIKDGTNIDSFADVETALALKQDKTDNSLQTTDKTVVGAVNELKSGLTNYQTQNNLNLEVPDRKNIAASVFNVETTTQYEVALYVDCKLEPSTTYTLSFNGTEGNKLYTNENVFSQESTITIGSGRTSVTVTTKSTIPSSEYTDGKGWKFLKNNIAQPNDNIFTDLQLELGSTATTFAPYIPSVESRIEAVESNQPVTVISVTADGVKTYAEILESLRSYSAFNCTLIIDNDVYQQMGVKKFANISITSNSGNIRITTMQMASNANKAFQTEIKSDGTSTVTEITQTVPTSGMAFSLVKYF